MSSSVRAAVWLLFAALLRLPAGAQESLDEARRSFERSRTPGISEPQRLEWLLRSVEAHPTHEAHYEIGKLERRAGRLDRALSHFEAAFERTDEDRYLARAAYQIGVTLHLLGDFVGARAWLRSSLSLAAHPEVRRTLRELELSRKGTVLSAEEILRELEVTRSFEVSRSELRVNFEINEALLDETGRRQADELGRALADPSAPRGPLLLLGHTDRLCPRARPDEAGCDAHNLELSERRAEAVRRYLASRFGVGAEDVRTLGCGRRHPLSLRASADDHYLNRRVVVLAPGAEVEDRESLCSRGAGLF